MARKQEKQNLSGFAQALLGDCVAVPGVLLRNYRHWGLDEQTLVVLLRCLRPLQLQGQISPAQIQAEFSLAAEDVAPLMQPLLDTGLFEVAENGAYSWQRLLSRIYEESLNGMRYCGPELAAAAPPSRSQDAEEQVRALSRLYRRFESELGRSLKFSENEKLRSWLMDDAVSEELVGEALSRSVLQGKPTMAYIGSILRSWKKQELTTLEQVQKLDVKQESKPAAGKKPERASGSGDKYAKLEREIMNS